MYSASPISSNRAAVSWLARFSAEDHRLLIYAESGHLHRIEHDLVLAHHAADAGDLGDARRLFSSFSARNQS